MILEMYNIEKRFGNFTALKFDELVFDNNR